MSTPYKSKSQADFHYRNKMYNDSLKLYDNSILQYNHWNKADKNFKVNDLGYVNKSPIKGFSNGSNVYVQDYNMDVNGNFEKNIKPLKYHKLQTISKTENVKDILDKGDGIYNYVAEYKKPEQKILPYKDNTLTKIPIKQVQQLSIEPEIKQIDIEDFKQSKDTQVNNYSASKYLQLKGKPSGYINEGNKQGIQEFKLGGNIEKDKYGNPILANIVNNSTTDRTYYDKRFNEINLGSDINNENKQSAIAHENYHAKQYKEGRSNFDIAHNTDEKIYNLLLKKPSINSTDEEFYKYHNRKAIETNIDINKFKNKNNSFKLVPDNLIYDRKIDNQQYKNPNSSEGEAQFYENNGFEYRNGGIINDYSNNYLNFIKNKNRK